MSHLTDTFSILTNIPITTHVGYWNVRLLNYFFDLFQISKKVNIPSAHYSSTKVESFCT